MAVAHKAHPPAHTAAFLVITGLFFGQNPPFCRLRPFCGFNIELFFFNAHERPPIRFCDYSLARTLGLTFIFPFSPSPPARRN